MNNISRDIIKDLLPVYLAGEASADTQALVKDWLARDPELARRASTTMDSLPEVPRLTEDNEMKALHQTRALLRARSWILAVAIFFSLSMISFNIGDGVISWMPMDRPSLALAFGLIGAAAWVGYAILRRKLGAARLP